MTMPERPRSLSLELPLHIALKSYSQPSSGILG